MTGYFSPDAPRKAAQSVLATSRRGAGFARALRFGPPLVSLSALIWAAPALAQTATTTVSANTSTPIVTSAAGDVTINGGAVVKPASGVAVTIDSNNTVTNNGVIQFQDVDNVTGILAQGGHTTQITNNGTIDVDETDQPSTDKNGIPHGPFAKGTNRYGIRVIGPGDFNGTIINGGAGTITVRGNNSFGISVETNLLGPLNSGGTIAVTGDNTIGIRTTGSIGGDTILGGTISASGVGAQAVNLGGPIAGQVLINGAISATGYRFTTRSSDPNFLKELQADDLLQGGPAVTIGGSVAKGIVVDVATVDSTGAALTSSGSISSFSAAPALVVGSAGQNITIGNITGASPAYGIDIRGAVLGSGVYDNVAAAAIQLGVPGGGTVDTSGGIHVGGTVAASSFAADSIALHLNAGVIAPVIRNDGTIAASIGSDAPGATARAIIIESGAVASSLLNANAIQATVTGQLANVSAVVDRSGTLSEVENIGAISATRTLTNVNQAITGQDTALDLSQNTSGVHIIQSTPAGATLTPSITGSVLLGSGADRVEILGGTVTGNLIDLGAGANTLTIDNGASVTGALNAAGGTVGLTVNTGSLQINNASQLKLTSLNLGAGSSLVVTADPSLGLATNLDVAGTANIASGAKIGVRFNSIQFGAATYTLIHATTLNAGTIDSTLLGNVPFLYTSSLQTNAAAGTILATVSLKTAQQLALPASTVGAFNAVITNIGRDPGLTGALLAQNTRTGFTTLYNQLLPNHSGSLFNMMAASVTAFAKPLDDRQDPVGGGFWLQETNLGLVANGHADDPGYKGWSIGAVGGYEIPRTPLGILGVTFGASTNQVYPDNTDSAENLHATLFDAGVYWRMTRGAFSANARISGDYARVTSNRVIEVLGGEGLAISRTANGNWSAFGVDARAMASYEAHFGRNIYVRPQAVVDYVRFVEGSYSESGGGDGMDLAVNSRTSSRFSAFAGVAVGALYGPDRSWGPEALVGYKAVASEVLGVTTARFVAGGDSFTLRSDDIGGQGAVVHLSLKGENGSGGFAVTTGAEARDGLNIYDLRLTGHVQF